MSGLVYIVDESTVDGALFMAILRDDLAAATKLIREGGNVNWRDNDWGTPR